MQCDKPIPVTGNHLDTIREEELSSYRSVVWIIRAHPELFLSVLTSVTFRLRRPRKAIVTSVCNIADGIGRSAVWPDSTAFIRLSRVMFVTDDGESIKIDRQWVLRRKKIHTKESFANKNGKNVRVVTSSSYSKGRKKRDLVMFASHFVWLEGAASKIASSGFSRSFLLNWGKLISDNEKYFFF